MPSLNLKCNSVNFKFGLDIFVWWFISQHFMFQYYTQNNSQISHIEYDPSGTSNLYFHV